MDPEVEHQWNLNAEKATSQTNKLQVQKKKKTATKKTTKWQQWMECLWQQQKDKMFLKHSTYM